MFFAERITASCHPEARSVEGSHTFLNTDSSPSVQNDSKLVQNDSKLAQKDSFLLAFLYSLEYPGIFGESRLYYISRN